MQYNKHIWLCIQPKTGLLFLFIAFCFASCTKYPEGGAVSRFTPSEKRVIGKWEVESFLIDGSDSISQLTCIKYNFFRVERDQQMGSEGCTVGGAGGEWGFKNHKRNLEITVEIYSGAKTPFPATNTWGDVSILSWEIQKLTNDQMWLKVNFNGKEYYTKFKKTGK